MRICVYCSSSASVDPIHVQAAREVGRLIAQRDHSLVYGGAHVGLMGILAQEVKTGGAEVIGILPRGIAQHGLASDHVDELIITETMAERKAAMIARAEAFLALAGGFGTLEELAEVLTLKQLGYHHRAIVLLNTGHIYDSLLQFFETLYEGHFAKPEQKLSYYVSGSPADAIQYIEDYQPPILGNKWL